MDITSLIREIVSTLSISKDIESSRVLPEEEDEPVITPKQGEEGNELAINFERKVSLEREDCKDELALGFHKFTCPSMATTII